ncbi:MAG: hypothetical protein KF749_14400 [Bacteroidetes bacterium]|nr:hypothetical protein [Bacteroidota bacterium]MCW5895693.1 hypothetical protein [Bacteroidota bacterium]
MKDLLDLLRSRGLLVASIVVVIVSSWSLHRTAGLGLPIPWADECLFVFPAVNIAQHNTLFTPEVNPERHLMWMPPAYSLVLGGVLKVVPYSLEFVRDISWVCTILLYIGLLRLLQSTAPIWIVVTFASMFLLASNFIVAGNTARMDAMALCWVCWGWYLLLRGKKYFSLAVLLITPLVHPYGLIFVVAALGYVWVKQRKYLQFPSVSESLSILIVLGCFVLYMLYVMEHWTGFLADMQFQIERKVSRNILQRLFDDPLTRSLAVAYPIALGTSAKFFPSKFPVLMFGAISLMGAGCRT